VRPKIYGNVFINKDLSGQILYNGPFKAFLPQLRANTGSLAILLSPEAHLKLLFHIILHPLCILLNSRENLFPSHFSFISESKIGHTEQGPEIKGVGDSNHFALVTQLVSISGYFQQTFPYRYCSLRVILMTESLTWKMNISFITPLQSEMDPTCLFLSMWYLWRFPL
jgi:hypothetical protein